MVEHNTNSTCRHCGCRILYVARDGAWRHTPSAADPKPCLNAQPVANEADSGN